MFWPQSLEVLPAIPLWTTPQPSSTSCPRGCLSENGSRPCTHRRYCARPFDMKWNRNDEPETVRPVAFHDGDMAAPVTRSCSTRSSGL